MSSVLTVNSVNYNQSSRKAHGLLIDAWGWDLDSDWFAEFHEYAANPQPQFTGPFPVSITVSGTTRFTGQIVSVEPTFGELGWTWGYRALGYGYMANWLPIVAVDGSGVILFNVDPSDQDNYFPSFAGQSVGQIISYCLTQHSTALSAIGITTDSTTASQLAALTLVPNDQVDVSGERLWQAMQSVLQRWARNMRLIVEPTGLVRCVDVTQGTAHTLTVGTDPIDPPLFSWNWTNCATSFVVRGRGNIEPAYVSQIRGSVTPAWNTTAQANWNWASFTNPAGATDNGTITTVNGPTQVTVQSSNPALTWATNYWDTVQAWIYCVSTTGSGLTYTEARPITANSALTAGGTATINLGYALSNTGSSAYNSYQIIGTNVPLSSGGTSDVWRLYDITDPGAWISAHLVRNFPVAVPFVDYFGTTAVLTQVPTCQIVKSGTAAPALFTVDPVHGQVLFTRPVIEPFNSQANLALGGSHVSAPDDVYMLLAYSRGALTAQYPSSGYSGTAYSSAGLQRTAYMDVDSWQYQGNTSLMSGLAQMMQQSVRDTQLEGTVYYKGFYATVEDATGHLMNIAGNGYTTGYETIAIPVRGVTYRYLNAGTEGLNYATEMRVSNRQDPRTGQSYYTHLSQLGTGVSLQSYGSFGSHNAIGPADVGETGTDFSGGQDAAGDYSGLAGPRGDRMAANSDLGDRREARMRANTDLGSDDDRTEDRMAANSDLGPGTGRYESQSARKKRAKAEQAQSQAFGRMLPGALGADLPQALPELAPGASSPRTGTTIDPLGQGALGADATPSPAPPPAPPAPPPPPPPPPPKPTLPVSAPVQQEGHTIPFKPIDMGAPSE